MAVQVIAVAAAGVPPCPMPDRFRHEIAYFMAAPGAPGVPELGPGEYWIPQADAQRWLADGYVGVVSPLDSHHEAEVELSEEQEAFLEWLLQHRVERVRFA